MELYSKIVEFFDNNEEKKKKIHNNYTKHIVLIAVLFIVVSIGVFCFYYISYIMSQLGLNSNKDGGYSDNHWDNTGIYALNNKQ